MRTEFRIRRAGGETFAQVGDLSVFERKLHEAIHTMWPMGGPFRIARPKDIHDFGPEKPEDTIVETVVRSINLPEVKLGEWFAIRKDGSDARLRARKVGVAEGSRILQTALNQLGDEYTFGSTGPDEFDCSGLVKFCYSRVDIDLRPPARDQIEDPQVTVFHERSKLKDGDLVFYDTKHDSKIDHVGIVDAPDMVVDASSNIANDKVVHREIDANNVFAFGRVQEVNGPLA